MKINVLNYLIAFVIILCVNFLLPRLMPCDPITAIYGEETLVQMSPELKAQLVEKYGLDRSLSVQLVNYLFSLVKGDLGYSYSRKAAVISVILSHLPWTFLLMGTALTLSTLAGIVLGIESGWRRNQRSDRILVFGMMCFSGMPSFFMGVILLSIFSVSFGLFPLQGSMTAYSGLTGTARCLDILKHLVLPASALMLTFISANYLLTRNSMIRVLREPFVLTAKAKGLSDGRVRYHHAGRNAMLPVVTATGIRFGARMITAALFVEIVFSYPGMGSLIYDAFLCRDYPLIQGCLLLSTVFVLGVNFAVELLYHGIDPRISHAR